MFGLDPSCVVEDDHLVAFEFSAIVTSEVLALMALWSYSAVKEEAPHGVELRVPMHGIASASECCVVYKTHEELMPMPAVS